MPAAAVAAGFPETPAAHLPLPLDMHTHPAESVPLAVVAEEAAATAVAAVGAGTAEAGTDTGTPRARPDLSAGEGDTANNFARPAVPSTGVDLAAAVTDLQPQVGAVYEIAAETGVHPWQEEGVDLAAAAAPESDVPPVGSGIHYNRVVGLAALVVSVAVVVMVVVAVGEELLLPFYRMTGVVCSSFDMRR